MKKTIIAATVLAACCASQAFAQASNFQGFSAALGVNVANTKTEVNGTSASDTDYDAALQLQYNWALGDSFLLGLGGTANVGDLKAGNFSGNQVKQKDAYSLYLAPGYAFNSNTLGYVKVAYLNAKLNDGTGGSVNFDNGYGLGLGVQSMFTRNWFGQAEYMYNQYNDRSIAPNGTVKLRSDVLTFSVGYKF